jgi:hypothetical protein
MVATVVARNSRYAIIDAGSKALSSDQGPHGTSLLGFGTVVIAEPAPETTWQIENVGGARFRALRPGPIACRFAAARLPKSFLLDSGLLRRLRAGRR